MKSTLQVNSRSRPQAMPTEHVRTYTLPGPEPRAKRLLKSGTERNGTVPPTKIRNVRNGTGSLGKKIVTTHYISFIQELKAMQK